MKAAINISFVVCVFFALSAIPTPIIDFYYYYLLVILLLPILIFHFGRFPSKIMVFFFIILILGLINVALGHTTISNTVKYWLGPFVLFLFYYYILAFKKFDFKNVFSLYLKASFWIALIGLIQVISHKVGFQQGYDFSWLGQERSYGSGVLSKSESFSSLYPVHSIFSEPSHFGQALSAAVFFSILSLFKPFIIKRYQAIVIILASFLTQSSTTYFVIFISIFLLLVNYVKIKNLIFASMILYFGGFFIYNNVEKFQSRLDSMFLISDSGLKNNINEIDGSSLILANHFHIAFENLKYHPIIGTGIGSHEFAHDKFSLAKGMYVDVFNIHDASSMFNRIMSEFGLLGLLSTTFFIIFYFKKRANNNMNSLHWIYNNASLVTIFVFLLRQGHFFIYGFPLFVLVYYFTGKKKKYVVD